KAPGAEASPPRREPPSPGRTERIVGITAAAVGVVALGVGIGFGVAAQQASDALSTLDKNRGVFDPAKESAGKTDQTLEGVFIGVGAALAVGGGVLAVLGFRAQRAQ